MIPESTLSEIRSRVDLVQIIGAHVRLKKTGQNLTGLCPFHQEKSASFHVNAAGQFFHCFGCHKGGNVFTFISLIEGLPFREAVKKLALQAGVELAEDRKYRIAQDPKSSTHPEIMRALDWAAKYFHFLLVNHKNSARAESFLKTRGILQKTIEKFQIGIAPSGWDTLLQLMLKRKFEIQTLIEAGLLVPKEGSKQGGYDRFRERLIFPIRNLTGEIIGFGGRLMEETSDQPKYINSPESPFFSKRDLLFGLYENQREVRLSKEVLIVEGYMDVVGLYQADIRNAVATMGTSLTEAQCRLLRRVAQKVITLFDPDRAGEDAFRRSVHMLLQHGLIAKDLSLPDGLDPDEFVLKAGSETFRELCLKAPRHLTKILKEIASFPLSEEQRSEWIRELTPILQASRWLPDRHVLWDDVALVLNVSRETIDELAAKTPPSGSAQIEPRKPPPTSEKAVRPKSSPLEIEFFRQAVEQWPYFKTVPVEAWAEGIKDSLLSDWLKKLADAKSTAQFSTLVEQMLSDGYLTELGHLSQSVLTQVLLEPPHKTEPQKLEPFLHCLRRVTERSREAQVRRLATQVKLAQRGGSEKEVLLLVEKLENLRKRPLPVILPGDR